MQITSGLPEGFNAGAYDMIVVGAGYAGAVCARRLAETIGYRVAVLERRSHIAGNAFDCTDEAGILVHEYGPHIYHTFNERVHNFLSRFTKWTDYQHKVLANINGTLMPVPFNHASLKLAFGDERGEELYQKLVETFGQAQAFRYRNLNLLADAGEILSIKTPGGSRFDRTIEPHAHIICTSCSRVIDVPLPFDAQLDATASEQIGWHVTSHYTIFEGLCPDCR